jgi:hypothetical protein
MREGAMTGSDTQDSRVKFERADLLVLLGLVALAAAIALFVVAHI